jgi:hypothetical protein
MKFLFTLLAGTFLMLQASAKNLEEIKLGTNHDSKKVEIRFNSKYKKNTAAVITVTNAEGKLVSTQSSDLICGDNNICLCEALSLPEGAYTVKMVTKKKTYTTQFIIWK